MFLVWCFDVVTFAIVHCLLRHVHGSLADQNAQPCNATQRNVFISLQASIAPHQASGWVRLSRNQVYGWEFISTMSLISQHKLQACNHCLPSEFLGQHAATFFFRPKSLDKMSSAQSSSWPNVGCSGLGFCISINAWSNKFRKFFCHPQANSQQFWISRRSILLTTSTKMLNQPLRWH